MTILVGLLGLGIVVFMHELGHFLAAKAVGIEVETFSLGWGPKLVGFKRKTTEYRLSLLPIGGFCRMKGDKEMLGALEKTGGASPGMEPGSFYHASPARRVIVSLAGPVANVLFAIIAFFVVYLVGFSVLSTQPIVLLESDYSAAAMDSPATVAGLKSGDRVVSVDGIAIDDFSGMREIVAGAGTRTLLFRVERAGRTMDVPVEPRYFPSEGISRIGVVPAIEPVVDSVTPGDSADIAGIRPGDRVVAIDGVETRWTRDIVLALGSGKREVECSILRGEETLKLPLVVTLDSKNQFDLGIVWRLENRVIRANGPLEAFGTALSETATTFMQTLAGLSKLFTGLDPRNAISGPARITMMIGEVSAQGFEAGAINGLITVLRFIAFLSIGLFIMNLLPIPALDGGMILLFLVEMARRKPLSMKLLYRFQVAGALIVVALLLLATLFDILFLAG